MYILKVTFYTLGCKVNQNETSALKRLFEENGFEIASSDDIADIYVVNSCTVTSGSDKKSRQWLRRAKRLNPCAVTVLTGCFPQAFPQEAAKALEADVITGSNGRLRIIDNIKKFIESGERIIDIAAHKTDDKFEELPLQNFKGHTRAFLKIEDGCNRQCSYCVIPRARGKVRSLSEETIIKHLKKLADNGYSEVVLSGINLSSYGKDSGVSLAYIIEKAAEVKGIERIRLGSLEPDLMDDDCINRLSKIDKICPQFHLALQSGCNRTLSRMNRLYTREEYFETVKKIKAAFKNATFTTDIIVGFPDETDNDYEDSLSFVKSVGFLKVHVFSYSRRSGTPADLMPNQIDENIKALRSRRMQKETDEIRAKIIAGFEGFEEEILLETPVSSNTFTGYTKTYIPCLVETKTKRTGEIITAKLGKFDGERCCTIIDNVVK